MRTEIITDPEAFWSLAREFLFAAPVLHSVLITNVDLRRSGAVTDPAPATYLAVRADTGAVVGAAMRTPPHAIWLSAMPPDAVEAAARALVDSCPDASGVTGVDPGVALFAKEWERRTGAVAHPRLRERIHRLDAVIPPRPVPGHWRPARPADRDLLIEWTRGFEADAAVYSTTAHPTSGETAEVVDQVVDQERARYGVNVDLRVSEGRAWLWEDDGPASYVGATRPHGGIVRIAPVYTPPARRGNGYASALVAAVSQAALGAGASACSLFTDLANPTSNKIYAAVGYRPVRDVTVYDFVSREVRP